MKQILAVLGLVLLFSARAEATWSTDMSAALKQAQAEKKVVFVNFTGSDWCGWCIRLKQEVFDQPDFQQFAAENLVLVELDFPRRKQIPAALKKQNEKLAQQYQVEGFPTIFLINGAGKTLAKAGYAAGGPRAYVEKLMKIPGVDWKRPSYAAASADNRTPGQPATAKSRPAPAPAYVKPAEIRYDDLILKGLTGPANKRMALINNHTFVTGETWPVKLGDKQIKITCKEIREESVLVQVDGKADPIELALGEKGGASKK